MQEKESLIGVYDVNGNQIAAKKRHEIDKSRDILKTVNIILFNESNEVFMIKARDSLWKGKWGGSCAGLVQSGEKLEAAALRTIRRELGFDAKLNFIEESYHNFEGVRKFLSVFVGRARDADLKPNRDDFLEWKWFDLESIKKMILVGECMLTFGASMDKLKII